MTHSPPRSLYHNQSLFTFDESCKFFGSARGCRHGSSCYYSHTKPTSIQLCRSYYTQGFCLFGDACNYRHAAHAYEADAPPKLDELCKYFNSQSGCSRQQRCRFQHIKDAHPVPKPDSIVRLYSMKQLAEMKLNLPHRTWQNKTQNIDHSTPDEDHTITVSQFNCLAQSLSYGGTDHTTFKCDAKYLIWEYRCKRLLYEIAQYKADIICLTEIDKVHYDSFYHPNLLSMQYKGMFLVKNGSICQDGVAIFWNTNKIQYTNTKHECILGDPRKCCQVALGIRLQLKSNNVAFDVWNTHLKAGRSNESELIRVEQCHILTDLMQKYSRETPVVLCGDLNFHFDDYENEEGELVRARAYKLLTEGDRVRDHAMVFESIWNDEERNTLTVYSGWRDGREVKACFDYIMLSNSKHFKVKQVLNAWPQSEIEKFECKLPNHVYPSDHFLIAAKIALVVDR